MIRRRTRRAFTFVELMAVIVILGTLGATSSILLASAIDSYVEAATRAQMHAELSVAVDRVAREFRRIALAPSVPGIAPDVSNCTASGMMWNDLDSDAYELLLSGSNLLLSSDGGASAHLLTDVTAMTLTYADEDDANLPPPMVASPATDPIRRIGISITVTRKGISETLSTKVYIRSCMSGA